MPTIPPRPRNHSAIASAGQSFNVVGTVAELPRVCRNRFIAALMLCSNSTMVSFGQSFLRISSHFAGSLEQHGKDSERLLGQAEGLALVREQFTRKQAKLEAFETDQPTGSYRNSSRHSPEFPEFYHFTGRLP